MAVAMATNTIWEFISSMPYPYYIDHVDIKPLLLHHDNPNHRPENLVLEFNLHDCGCHTLPNGLFVEFMSQRLTARSLPPMDLGMSSSWIRVRTKLLSMSLDLLVVESVVHQIRCFMAYAPPVHYNGLRVNIRRVTVVPVNWSAHFLHWHRNLALVRQEEERNDRFAPDGEAVKTAMGRLKSVGVEDEEGLKEESCSICLEKYLPAVDAAVVLPCKHVFHGGCIQNWFRRSLLCPLCRTSLK